MSPPPPQQSDEQLLSDLKVVPAPASSDADLSAAVLSRVRAGLATTNLAVFGFVRIWTALLGIGSVIAAALLTPSSKAPTPAPEESIDGTKNP